MPDRNPTSMISFYPLLSFLGGDLREVCAALYRHGPVAGRTELPRHRHSPWNDPGGEALQVR